MAVIGVALYADTRAGPEIRGFEDSRIRTTSRGLRPNWFLEGFGLGVAAFAMSIGRLNEKSPGSLSDPGLVKVPGGDLLSHRVSPAVPSALEDLTSEFEMGSGVTPPV